jgi:hypothetical protein
MQCVVCDRFVANIAPHKCASYHGPCAGIKYEIGGSKSKKGCWWTWQTTGHCCPVYVRNFNHAELGRFPIFIHIITKCLRVAKMMFLSWWWTDFLSAGRARPLPTSTGRPLSLLGFVLKPGPKLALQLCPTLGSDYHYIMYMSDYCNTQMVSVLSFS